jgi:hypothetical protein
MLVDRVERDAVFEVGGVKGIGLVGAVAEVEKAGYEFENLAGTSAGAIKRIDAGVKDSRASGANLGGQGWQGRGRTQRLGRICDRRGEHGD